MDVRARATKLMRRLRKSRSYDVVGWTPRYTQSEIALAMEKAGAHKWTRCGHDDPWFVRAQPGVFFFCFLAGLGTVVTGLQALFTDLPMAVFVAFALATGSSMLLGMGLLRKEERWTRTLPGGAVSASRQALERGDVHVPSATRGVITAVQHLEFPALIWDQLSRRSASTMTCQAFLFTTDGGEVWLVDGPYVEAAGFWGERNGPHISYADVGDAVIVLVSDAGSLVAAPSWAATSLRSDGYRLRRVRRIAGSPDRPIQVVVAAKADTIVVDRRVIM